MSDSIKELAERMLAAMMDEAMGSPVDRVAEAAVSCAIAIIRGCAKTAGTSETDALIMAATKLVDAAKRKAA